jgi:hypothetical protein
MASLLECNARVSCALSSLYRGLSLVHSLEKPRLLVYCYILKIFRIFSKVVEPRHRSIYPRGSNETCWLR